MGFVYYILSLQVFMLRISLFAFNIDILSGICIIYCFMSGGISGSFRELGSVNLTVKL
jgi:hypothetical protein